MIKDTKPAEEDHLLDSLRERTIVKGIDSSIYRTTDLSTLASQRTNMLPYSRVVSARPEVQSPADCMRS